MAKYTTSIEILYRPGKVYRNADSLSCILNKTDIKDSLAEQYIQESENRDIDIITIFAAPLEAAEQDILSFTTIYIYNKTAKAIARLILSDKAFSKVYRKILQKFNNSPCNIRVCTFEDFRLDKQTKLLFFRDSPTEEQLCIPRKYLKPVLKLVYNDRVYIGIPRVREYLRCYIFFLRLNKEIRD